VRGSDPPAAPGLGAPRVRGLLPPGTREAAR
jgi:hypothetical protein